MKELSLITSAALLAVSAVADPADPQISNVRLAQDSMSRCVTVQYDLDERAVVTMDVLTNGVSIGGANIQGVMGDCFKIVSAGSDHVVTWYPHHSWPDHKFGAGVVSVRMTAWALDNTPDYMAVDISATGGEGRQAYYPSADFVPGGVTNSKYKTSMLLMRKIMAKDVTWTMGSVDEPGGGSNETTHQVTLANNYYIGVYEVTQSQWSLVATNSATQANFTTERHMRPMENVSYNEIRNTHKTSSSATTINAGTLAATPSSDSFLGLLRLKTGIDFDLPSEAQWEFAARAGNGIGYWNDGSSIKSQYNDANLRQLCRYEFTGGKDADSAADCEVTNGTAIVGSYAPSDWGIYDMHGNVAEWCLDWYEANIATAKDASGNYYGGRVNIDPSNPANFLSGGSASGTSRVLRGGYFISPASTCRSAYRGRYPPNSIFRAYGFRVVCTAGLQ